MSKGNQVANGLTVLQSDAVPEYIRQGDARGNENVTVDDLVIPRLEIIQGLSPAVKRGDPGFIKGAAPGMFINSVTRELYGEEVAVIPVHYSMQYLVWRDRKLASDLKISADGGFFGSYQTRQEAQARADQEGGEKKAVIVVDTPTHLCLLLNNRSGKAEEIMIPMPRTKSKISRQWNSMIRLAGGDRFSRVYKLTADLQKNDKGDFYNYKVELLGFPSKELYLQAEALYEAVTSGKMRTADYGGVSEYSYSSDM